MKEGKERNLKKKEGMKEQNNEGRKRKGGRREAIKEGRKANEDQFLFAKGIDLEGYGHSRPNL
jgi:hypothetical protein